MNSKLPKGGFFRKYNVVFKSPKQIIQLIIQNVIFKFPANNSKQLIQISSPG